MSSRCIHHAERVSTVPKPKGPEKWQLYNLAKDPGEIHDLADQEPERMEKMTKLWDQYVLETGVVPLAPELGSVSQRRQKRDFFLLSPDSF